MFDPLALKTVFLLRPDIVFLNHGSFGACPRPVFNIYQQWQLEMEKQPVEFLGRRHDDLLDHARAALAEYLHSPTDSLIFVPNATTGINIVARSLSLQPGDEILTTDQEYGAMDYTWEFVCAKSGATYLKHPLIAHEGAAEGFVESFWSRVTDRTRVIFLSHITSATATILPIAEICRRARQRGILTVIDGAHAPGQIPLDLTQIDADCYTGNCHKWLCAPKGAAFLYVQPHLHPIIEPAVISWGWLPGASFSKRNGWQGTRDIAAYLSVPAAIQFQEANDWDAIRAYGHELARSTRQRFADLTGIAPLVPDSPDWFAQMIAIPLACDAEALQKRLREEYAIEIPFTRWNDKMGIRASFQGYNTQEDADLLLEAVKRLLPEMARM